MNAKEIRAQLSKMGEGWNRLHPEVQDRAVLVMMDAKKAGLNIGVFDGYRARKDQVKQIEEGDSFIVDPDSSYHRWGLAVDFVFLDSLGRWTWEPEGGRAAWWHLGAIIEKHGFNWGGRWRTFDGPHAEYKVMNIAKLKETYTTPEAVQWA